jgi:hypothetical protein
MIFERGTNILHSHSSSHYTYIVFVVNFISRNKSKRFRKTS